MQNSIKPLIPIAPPFAVCLLAAVFPTGCVVTTHNGAGTPPVAAVEERRIIRAPTGEDLPGEIGAKHLLVQYAGSQGAPRQITRTKEEARARAEEALTRAKAGEDFDALVTEYSDEPGAGERGGSLGRFQHHAMVRPFSDAAFRLKIGQLSNVVETPFGFHVILRTE